LPRLRAGRRWYGFFLAEIEARFPPKLEFLFRPKRYKVTYGGRGGAKSWGFARALLIQAAQRKLRILCTREVQKSIKQSVHRLLSDLIVASGWSHLFDVQATVIRCLRALNPPEAHQRRTADKLRAKWFELDTGHYPMLSAPDELARMISA